MTSQRSTEHTRDSIKSTDSDNTILHKEILELYEKAAHEAGERNGLDSFASSSTKTSSSIVEVPLDDEAAGQDTNLVWWDGDNDPENPMNWPKWKKTLNLSVVFLLCFVSPFASSSFVPAILDIMAEFGTNNSYLAGFAVGVYVLGFAVGPLVIGPLSEVYGRVIMYHVCNSIFVLFNILCGFSYNLNFLAAMRFFAGVGGSHVFALAPATIADMVEPHRRGSMMALVAMGLQLGPAVGPIVGSYLNYAKGWAWIFFMIAIIGGVCMMAGLVVFSETYAPILLEREVRGLRERNGNEKFRSKLDTGIPHRKLFLTAMLRPLHMLLLSPNVFLVSLLTAVGYGYMYLMFSTFPAVFTTIYDWPSRSVGVVYLGTAVGNLLGICLGGITSDVIMKKRAAAADTKPENRLIPMIFLWPLVSIGLFIYGWGIEKEVHWFVPVLGTAVFGFGSMATILSASTYLVDAYTIHAASASAASVVFRSLLGGLVPLFAYKLYQGLGFGWGHSLLAFLALVLAPVPFFFYRYGERLRSRFRVSL
ncbi:MFS general substrate transporter [Zopfia rhizophila CBS 207.26]|uniref:MFS general substrate transporter n=1 Tax=Zopfia rhizophila CBS 207.26 TaxID=1314779 RepID=A0A6A6EKB1_9PEZI|nr:MFS general substrate transporter [Zopfia rhizophila CBS 207.26]